MLRNRLLSASFLIGGSLIFVGLDAWAYNFGCPGLWILPLGVYLIYGSAIECTSMVARSRFGPITAPALIACAIVMLAGTTVVFFPLFENKLVENGGLQFEVPLISAAFSMVFCFIWFFNEYQHEKGVFERCVLAGWIACYFGICFSLAIATRMLGEPGWGLYLLVGFIVVTKFADSGAYFAGKSLGRTKLCSRVSPNKTVEGLVGGMVVASLAAWVYFGWAAPRIFGSENVTTTHLGILSLGIGLTLAGLAGDLLQSVFKREMGVKDSGNLLPGLGGLWDVTDSLLPAIAFGYVLARVGSVLGPGQ